MIVHESGEQYSGEHWRHLFPAALRRTARTWAAISR